jgi:sugar lactone lactonase YvrE
MKRSLVLARALVLASTLVLTLSSSSRAGAWPESAVLVADRTDDMRYDGFSLMVLDPASLEVYATTGNVKSSSNSIMAPDAWALAADGNTLVALESAWSVAGQRFERSMVVRHGLVGNERGRFPLPEPLGYPWLSADGSRMVASAVDAAGEPTFGAYVLDTRDGRVLSHAPGLNLDEELTFVEPTGRRAIRVTPSGPGAAGPEPAPGVTVLDLETGAVLARLDFADMPAEPALALSPDGQRLAVLDSTTERLTLIGLDPLSVERSFALRSEPSALQSVLEFVGVLPRVAHAKPEHGTERQVAFSADGKRLFVYGSEFDGSKMRGLGLRLVDLPSERVVASGLEDRLITDLLRSADGQGVFAWGPSDAAIDGFTHAMPFTLQRVDASTLEVLASREFVGPRQVLLWPSVPTS